MRTPIAYFVVLSGVLFTLGTLGVLLRKNALLIFMSVELQLNAVNDPGNTQALAKILFRNYFFPFEATSILLIVAAIAAMVLGQRKARAVTQSELEAMREMGT